MQFSRIYFCYYFHCLRTNIPRNVLLSLRSNNILSVFPSKSFSFFLSKNFMILGILLKNLIHFDLIFVYTMRQCFCVLFLLFTFLFFFFAYGYIIFPTPFIEFYLYVLCSFVVSNCPHVNGSVPLICLSLYLGIPFCFGYYSFVT